MTKTKTAGKPSALRTVLTPLAGTLTCLLLLPLFLLFGMSLQAWVIGASFVLANALIHALIAWIVRDASLAVALGAMGFSLLFRAGITALVIFFIGAQIGGVSGDSTFGLGRPHLALAVIAVFLIGFTIDAAIDTLKRAAERTTIMNTTPQENPA